MNKKRCTRCHKLLPTSDFYVDRRGKDGLSPWCKACCAEYYQANKDERLAYGRRHYADQLAKLARLTQDRADLLEALKAALPHVSAEAFWNETAQSKRAEAQVVAAIAKAEGAEE